MYIVHLSFMEKGMIITTYIESVQKKDEVFSYNLSNHIFAFLLN